MIYENSMKTNDKDNNLSKEPNLNQFIPTNINFSNLEIQNCFKKLKTKNQYSIKYIKEFMNKSQVETISPNNEIFTLIKPKYFNNEKKNLFSRYNKSMNYNNNYKIPSSSFAKMNQFFLIHSITKEEEKSDIINQSFCPIKINKTLFPFESKKQLKFANSIYKNIKRKNIGDKSFIIDKLNINKNYKSQGINTSLKTKIIENKETFRYVISSKEFPNFKGKGNSSKNKKKSPSKNFYSFSKFIQRSKIKNNNNKDINNYIKIVNIFEMNKNKIPLCNTRPKTIYDIYDENKHLFKCKSQIFVLRNKKNHYNFLGN